MAASSRRVLVMVMLLPLHFGSRRDEIALSGELARTAAVAQDPRGADRTTTLEVNLQFGSVPSSETTRAFSPQRQTTLRLVAAPASRHDRRRAGGCRWRHRRFRSRLPVSPPTARPQCGHQLLMWPPSSQVAQERTLRCIKPETSAMSS